MQLQRNQCLLQQIPHPATSSYLKAPRAIKLKPTITIIVVAQAKTVFLFIAIIKFFFQLRRILVKTQGQIFTDSYNLDQIIRLKYHPFAQIE